ncbi:MAG: hypothetical protein ACREFY_18315, partial [Acetobacteraceae bacterium]
RREREPASGVAARGRRKARQFGIFTQGTDAPGAPVTAGDDPWERASLGNDALGNDALGDERSANAWAADGVPAGAQPVPARRGPGRPRRVWAVPTPAATKRATTKRKPKATKRAAGRPKLALKAATKPKPVKWWIKTAARTKPVAKPTATRRRSPRSF